jgi:hypothetical protein
MCSPINPHLAPSTSPPVPGARKGFGIADVMFAIAVVFAIALVLWVNKGLLAWLCRVAPDSNMRAKVVAGRYFLASAEAEVSIIDNNIDSLKRLLIDADERIEAGKRAITVHQATYPNGEDPSGQKSGRELALDRVRLETALETELNIRASHQQQIEELRTARANARLEVARMRLELTRYECKAYSAYRQHPDNPLNAARTFFNIGR